MRNSERDSIRRLLGYAPAQPLSLYAKAVLGSIPIAIVCAWTATAVADNATSPDFVRYLVSPGWLLAARFASQQTYTFSEVLNQLARFAEIELITNFMFYEMLSFGMAIIFAALRNSSRQRSTSRIFR